VDACGAARQRSDPLSVVRISPDVVVDAQAQLGETPIWDAVRQALVWVEIQAGRVHRTRVDGSTETVLEIDGSVSFAIPTADDGLLVGHRSQIDVCINGSSEALTSVAGGEFGRLSDGKCDARGRLWTGGISYNPARSPACPLVRVDPDGSVRTRLSGVSASNGIGWTMDDDRMYYIDSMRQTVDVFRFDLEAGDISDRRVFAAFPPTQGLPDGLTVDDEDGVWVALYGGSRVVRYTAGGDLDRVIEMPVRRVTSCAFGGSEGDILFITSDGREGEEPLEPHAGALFACRPGPRGTRSDRFGQSWSPSNH